MNFRVVKILMLLTYKKIQISFLKFSADAILDLDIGQDMYNLKQCYNSIKQQQHFYKNLFLQFEKGS